MNKAHFEDTELRFGSEKLYINPKMKLAIAWILFLVVCVIFVFAVKGKSDEKETDIAGNTSTENAAGAENAEGGAYQMTPYELDAYPDLNTFIQQYLDAMVACDGETLKTLVLDGTQYDDMSALIARAEFIKGYTNLHCYTKPGYVENSYIVFAVTNTAIANVTTQPMDIMVLYVLKDETGAYKINNYTLDDQTKLYISNAKQDQDIQEVMAQIDANNSQAATQDPTLQAFYDMLGQ